MFIVLGLILVVVWALIKLAHLGYPEPLTILVSAIFLQILWKVVFRPFIDMVSSGSTHSAISSPTETLQSNGLPPIAWEAEPIEEKEE